MKRIVILMMIICLLCGLMSGCIHAAAGENTPDGAVPGSDAAADTAGTETTDPAEETVEIEEIPQGTVPFVVPDESLETVPPQIDDSDYQLPPGETPTYEPQVS